MEKKNFGVDVGVGGFKGWGNLKNNPSQKVALTTSNGQSVVAEVNGKKVNIPAEVKISRSKGAVVRVLAEDNPGYETTQFVITGKNKLSGIFWLNMLSGGTTGSTTDALTGSMWTYSNTNFVVPVSKKGR